MGRLGLTKQIVEKAAEEYLADTNQIPTVVALRELLGCGSHTTIHKYLNTWKKSKLKSSSIVNNDSILALEELQLEKDELEDNISHINHKYKVASSGLISAERKIMNMQIENDKNNQDLVDLQKNNDKLNAEIGILKSSLLERDSGIERYQKDKQAQIESLKIEMKNLHQSYLAEIRELSSSMNDKVVDAKVEIVNLEVKLKEKIRDLQQQSNSVLVLQQDNATLKRQLKTLKKYIADLPDEYKEKYIENIEPLD